MERKSKGATIITLIIAGLILWSLVLSGSALADCRTDGFKTYPEAWIKYGGTLEVAGEPAQVGDEVRAYVTSVEVNGGCIGMNTISTQGQYLITIYGDDPSTDGKDGAVNGDTINFVICHNGVEYGFVQTAVWDSENNNSSILKFEAGTLFRFISAPKLPIIAISARVIAIPPLEQS